jgi:hypothetical protein
MRWTLRRTSLNIIYGYPVSTNIYGAVGPPAFTIETRSESALDTIEAVVLAAFSEASRFEATP